MNKINYYKLLIATPIFIASLTTMNANAGWGDDKIDDVVKKVTNVNSRTITLVRDVADMKDSVVKNTKSGLSVLTSNVKQQIDQVIIDLPKILANAQQVQKVSAFLGSNNACDTSSECFQFKSNLKAYLSKTYDLSVGLSSLYQSPANIEQLKLDELLNLIDWAPPQALYPLYLILGKIINNESIAGLEQASVSMTDYTDIFTSEFSELGSNSITQTSTLTLQSFTPDNSGFQTYTCNVLKEKHTLAKGASWTLGGIGAGLRVIGAVSKLLGHSYVAGPTAKDAGVHGYVHMQIENNWLMMLGSFTNITGEVLMTTSNYGFNKINYCRLLNNQEQIYTQLNDTIEQSLTTCSPTVSLILPEDKGGQFNIAIEIVENRIDQLNQLGLDTNKSYRYWQRAQDKSYQGDYGKSFKTLCKSYKALVGNSHDDHDRD